MVAEITLPGVSAVIVIGAINADLVVSAAALPGPGETVVGRRVERHGGGKGANAAVAAARLGADVALVGAVGDDDLGSALLDELAGEGVGLDTVQRLRDEVSGAALIVVDESGENQIAVGAGANALVDAGLVERALTPILADAGVVLVSCEIPLSGVRAAAELAHRAGVRLVVNPAPVLDGLLDLAGCAPLLTPNTHEAAALTGEEHPEAAAGVLAERTVAPVVVTLGADGVVLADPRPRRLPAATPARVVDTTGAGDAFNGALAAELARGCGIEDAVAFAVRAAARAVERPGARGGMPVRDAV
jgi:ribokinase